MLKYAKITDEETKECSVGLGNPDEVFSEELIPAKTHIEIIPAEYDEEGNIIKEEEQVEVVDEEEYLKTITVGDWYKSIGMEETDVEEAYNHRWYLKGSAPEKPQSEIEAEKIVELQQYLNDTDWYAVRYAETGVEIPEEVRAERQQAREKIDALRELQKTLI